MGRQFILQAFFACAFGTVAFAAADAKVEMLSPGDPGGYVFVAEPTAAKLASLAAAGKSPLVEALDPVDDAVAFTNFAKHASAVAFEKIPRYNILHSWKAIGTKVLKTVRYYPEGSAEHFRREAGFKAFQAGADGLWLPNAAELPENFRQALREAAEDWRILLYFRDLRDKAGASEDGIVRTDSRRATYWIGYMPASWENLDTLRLETVAWAKRLEQVLGLPEADLPVVPAKPIAENLAARPFAGFAEKPVDVAVKKIGVNELENLGGGLKFRSNYSGFTLSYTTTNGPEIAKYSNPGGALDFAVYIPSTNGVDYLPYTLHCDLDPAWRGERAPALGRGSLLFGTDERFKPYSIAYGVPNIRVKHWPQVRSYGPDYPDLRASYSLDPVKGGGWTASVTVSWLALYGHWPMLKNGVGDVWYVGLLKSPETGKPLLFRLAWPKGYEGEYPKIAAGMTTGAISNIYKEELARTYEVWMTAFREHYYPFAKTAKPCFNRYDLESDEMFRTRLLQPLLDANENAWQLIWTDKEHTNPKFNAQVDAVKLKIWKKLGKMLFLSYDAGLLRRDYLRDRFAGKEPAEYVKKEDTSRASAPVGPDVDFDDGAIQLDDVEF